VIISFLAALFIGISLGLLGSGGSIITLPVLIFILDRPEKLAIGESLAIVGIVACAGAVSYAWRSRIVWKIVFFFGLPGVFGAFLGAYSSYHVSSKVQLILFAMIMIAASGSMYFTNKKHDPISHPTHPNWMMILEGAFIGFLTGLLGIGGGFMIVPTLLFVMGLSMNYAVGTSLVIITINALSGFLEQLSVLDKLDLEVNWHLILIFSMVGILGTLGGSFLANKISQKKIKSIFSLNLLCIGIYILFKKIYT
jgi:uncharacterized protein